nr:gtp-binding protein rhoa [Quercus suber]
MLLCSIFLTVDSRLTLGNDYAPSTPLPTLRDLNQPFPFDIRMYNTLYRFEFYDTASPENYTLLKPAVLILCYSIADPGSLQNLRTRWKVLAESHFNYDEELPVIVLGLKRDIRQKEDYDGRVRQVASDRTIEDDMQPINSRTFVYPQEALRIAQEMRCDRYCECSATTGELCREVFEDIAKTAAKTTTEKGGRTAGMECSIAMAWSKIRPGLRISDLCTYKLALRQAVSSLSAKEAISQTRLPSTSLVSIDLAGSSITATARDKSLQPYLVNDSPRLVRAVQSRFAPTSLSAYMKIRNTVLFMTP